MAIRGRKPTPHLRIVTGSHIKDRPPPKPRETDSPVAGGPAEKPKRLKGPAGKHWDTYIARCHWLTWADGPKATMWCHLMAEYEKNPTGMIASRIAQLRALGSELGFDVASRDRMGVTIPTGRQAQQESKPDDGKKEPVSPAKKYFE
jgi:hypothetical protein